MLNLIVTVTVNLQDNAHAQLSLATTKLICSYLVFHQLSAFATNSSAGSLSDQNGERRGSVCQGKPLRAPNALQLAAACNRKHLVSQRMMKLLAMVQSINHFSKEREMKFLHNYERRRKSTYHCWGKRQHLLRWHFCT